MVKKIEFCGDLIYGWPLSSFPFDSHECILNVASGRLEDDVSKLFLKPFQIIYGSTETNIDEKLQSYEMRLESDKSKVYDSKAAYESAQFSFTGMILKLKRKSLGHLASSYYYPTACFALLSLISYLIKPDIVSF